MTRRPWRLGLVLFIVLALPEVAFADRRADARRYFRRAMAQIDLGKPLDAIDLLKKAYEAQPHPNVLYNIAQLYASADRPEEAVEYFERYLASGPEDADAVSAQVAALRGRIAPPPSSASVAAAPTRSTTVTVDLSAIERSRDLMQTLAQATDSDRLRKAADDLSQLEARLSQGALPSAPAPVAASPAPAPSTTATQATPPPARSAPRGEDIYDARIVSASRYIQSPLDAPSATHIITREEILATGLSNIGELLRRVPGADVMTNSPADVNVSLRGFNQRLSNRLLVLIDGRSVYFDALGTTFWHTLTISVEDIERIEVIRGPASALYGADAFAGVVNIITRLPGEGGSEVVAGGGSHGWFHEHASASGRSGRLGYRMSAGFDNANRFSQELSEERVDHVPNFGDQSLAWRMIRANGAFSYRASKDVGLILRGGVSHGRSEWQATSGLRDFGMDANSNAFASAQLDTSYGLVRVFYNRIDAEGGPQYVPLGNDPYRFNLVSSTLDSEAMFSREFHLIVKHNLQAGGSYRLKQVEWNYLDRGRTEHHFALFLQDTLQITPWLRFQGSIRADFHPLLETPPISPRGALILRPSKDSALRLAAGTAFRTPSFLESYVDVGANFDVPALTGTTRGSEVIGRDLEPEQVFSLELSYMNSASEFFDVEVVGYYSRISDLAPVPVPDPADLARLHELGGDDPRQEFDPYLGVFTVGDALYRNEDASYDAFGGELSVRAYPVDGLDVYLNYALEKILTRGQEISEYRFQDRTSLHKLNAGLRYRTEVGLDLQADLHYASSQLWSELTITGGATSVDAIRTVPYQLPAFYLVNARVAYRLLDDNLELGVAGFNITNNRHRQHPFGQLLGARVLGTVKVKL